MKFLKRIIKIMFWIQWTIINIALVISVNYNEEIMENKILIQSTAIVIIFLALFLILYVSGYVIKIIVRPFEKNRKIHDKLNDRILKHINKLEDGYIEDSKIKFEQYIPKNKKVFIEGKGLYSLEGNILTFEKDKIGDLK